MDSTLADFILEDSNWENELSSLFPQNNEVFLMFNSDPVFSFHDSSSGSNIVNMQGFESFYENQPLFTTTPIQQQQQIDSNTQESNLEFSLNENVSDSFVSNNHHLVESMTPLFEEQIQSTLSSLLEQPFQSNLAFSQPNPPPVEESKKKRKESSISDTNLEQQSKKRKKDNSFMMNNSVTVSSAGISSSLSSTSSTSNKKKSNSKRKGWLENICSSIDKPAEELVLPPVVGNGGKRILRFHTVNFK